MGDTNEPDKKDCWDKYVRSEAIDHGARVRPVSKRVPRTVRRLERDPAIFAKNLSDLIRHDGMTKADAPTKIGVRSRWLHRATTSGLARIDKRSRADLERIANHFGLAEPDELWDADLPQLQHQPAVDQQISRCRMKVNWPYANKLLELLETGDHEFLKGLIDTLYNSLFTSYANIPEVPVSTRTSRRQGSDLKSRIKGVSRRH